MTSGEMHFSQSVHCRGYIQMFLLLFLMLYDRVGEVLCEKQPFKPK